jgi:SAM-dependent methyltransferase
MIEPEAGNDPRWGSEGRDAKALALLGTLRAEVGNRVVDGKWLDLGCGSGLIACSLAPQVGSILGVDPEPWARWQGLQSAHANLRFAVGGVDQLQGLVPDNSVDVAICNQVYEHVPNPAALVHELYRVIKPGGSVYFAGPNLVWPIEPHVHLPFVHWLPREAVIRVLSSLGVSRIHGLDAWSLDAWRLRKLLAGAGFTVSSAFAVRARAGLDAGEGGLAVRLAAMMPHWLERLLLPLLPGFVFVLRKPRP